MKFTAQGEVAFRVCVHPERLRFEVKDTGKGIPKEDLPSLFKPFYQATTTIVTGQGVGLGLHISKQIVGNALGGEITIAIELGQGQYGQFSKFLFEALIRLALNCVRLRSSVMKGRDARFWWWTMSRSIVPS